MQRRHEPGPAVGEWHDADDDRTRAAWRQPAAIASAASAAVIDPPNESGATSTRNERAARSQPGRAPDREPAGQIGLDLHVVGDDTLHLDLEGVVALLGRRRVARTG